jgi:hypothetical protein
MATQDKTRRTAKGTRSTEMSRELVPQRKRKTKERMRIGRILVSLALPQPHHFSLALRWAACKDEAVNDDEVAVARGQSFQPERPGDPLPVRQPATAGPRLAIGRRAWRLRLDYLVLRSMLCYAMLYYAMLFVQCSAVLSVRKSRDSLDDLSASSETATQCWPWRRTSEADSVTGR